LAGVNSVFPCCWENPAVPAAVTPKLKLFSIPAGTSWAARDEPQAKRSHLE
jgi:hypothetical protein